MKTLDPTRLAPPLMLHDRTAADLMTPNPKSARQAATVSEAAAFLSLRGISAAPVIDEAGRPVGVVSRTDLLNHRSQRAAYLPGATGRVGEDPGPVPLADEGVLVGVVSAFDVLRGLGRPCAPAG